METEKNKEAKLTPMFTMRGKQMAPQGTLSSGLTCSPWIYFNCSAVQHCFCLVSLEWLAELDGSVDTTITLPPIQAPYLAITLNRELS
ncbi:hypothetical protein Y1Q_0010199 [Alligator mississippiensis]|uniref:Uncharacterized protein n=1 Tax=Alligator mississippiensis TaxID=8496 RepID=A0A151NGX5_ALLMI|nr:hypothetical protein Y1Q_0010199 [Alligator mississippiensis]